MGKVFVATHLSLGQPFAIKVIARESGEVVDRFRREARRAARFRGEHVVRVIDVGDLPGGMPYMVMELLHGRDLGDLLRERKRIHWSEAVHYLLQACLGLAEVHASHVVHRDLKPSNLFLSQGVDQSVVLKILDFGIAKELLLVVEAGVEQPLTRTNSMLGSPQYMSPEQIRSSRSVGIETDIWALGVVLYQLVTGRLPFSSLGLAQLLTEVCERDLPRPSLFLPELPPGLEAIIMTCLDRDPARRPHVAALAAAIAPHGPPLSRVIAERVERVFDAGPRASLTSFVAVTEAQVAAFSAAHGVAPVPARLASPPPRESEPPLLNAHLAWSEPPELSPDEMSVTWNSTPGDSKMTMKVALRGDQVKLATLEQENDVLSLESAATEDQAPPTSRDPALEQQMVEEAAAHQRHSPAPPPRPDPQEPAPPAVAPSGLPAPAPARPRPRAAVLLVVLAVLAVGAAAMLRGDGCLGSFSSGPRPGILT